MSDTNRALTNKIHKIFEALGIEAMGQDVEELSFIHPVNSILITTTDTAPQAYGTWDLLTSGHVLGPVGEVYVWERTA